jgi:hypothetical protein
MTRAESSQSRISGPDVLVAIGFMLLLAGLYIVLGLGGALMAGGFMLMLLGILAAGRRANQ